MDRLPQDEQLLKDFSSEIERSCRDLEQSAQYLSKDLSDEMLEELNDCLNGELSRVDEEALRSEMGWTEKKLLWTWARLQKLKSLRREVARDWMRNHSLQGKLGEKEKK
ncbi:MAG: hypothetical protein V3V31_06380 [Methylococcales bacterium]